MSDDLEIIDIRADDDDGSDGPAGEASGDGRRGQRAPLPPEARRARRRAAAGVALTLLLLALLAGAGYVSWAVASVRHIDRLVAQATALERGLLQAQTTWHERLLPEEEHLRRDLEAELDGAREDLHRLAEAVEETSTPPDGRVAAYRRAAADGIRHAAAASEKTPWAASPEPALSRNRNIPEARARIDDRFPLMARVATEEPTEVLSAGLRSRLPDPDVLFSGDCGCRIRALTAFSTEPLRVVEIELIAGRHRQDRETASTSRSGPPLHDDLNFPAFQSKEGEIGITLRNGDTMWFPRGGGLPYPTGDALVFLGALPGSSSRVTVIDLDDGDLHPIADTVADRVISSSGNVVILGHTSSSALLTLDTTTLETTSWTSADLTWIEDAVLSPDGSAIAVAGVRRGAWGIAVLDGSGGRWLAEGDRPHGRRFGSVRWTADGRWLFWLQGQTGTNADVFNWIRGARADGSEGPFTVRAAGRYQAMDIVAR